MAVPETVGPGNGEFTADFKYPHNADCTVDGIPFYYGYQVYNLVPLRPLPYRA